MNTGAIIIEELRSILKVDSSTDIDSNVSFRKLGGNSLLALKLVGRCRKRGVILLVNNVLQSETISEILSSASTSDFDYGDNDPRDDQNNPRHPVLDELLSGTRGTPISAPADLAPLGGLQTSFLYESSRHTGTNLIQHIEVYRLQDMPHVKAGWQLVWQREAMLRTRYSGDLVPERVGRFDWEELDTEDPKLFDKWALGIELPTMNDFASSWRVLNLVKGAEKRSVVIWTIHHALIDGYSAQLVLTKVRRAASGLPVSPGPCFDRVMRDLDRMREANKSEGIAFWERVRTVRAEAATTLQLPPPSIPPCPSNDTHSPPVEDIYGEFHLDLGAGWNRGTLSGIAKRANVTPAVIYHAAWALVMTVFADSDTVCFGTAVSGRNLPVDGIDEAVGPILNALPFCVDMADSDMSLGELLCKTQQQLTDLARFSWTTVEHGFARDFQCLLAMQFQADEDDGGCFDDGAGAAETIRPIQRPVSRQTSDMPLSILVDEAYDRVRLQYNARSMSSCRIENLAMLYQHVLRCFVRLDNPVGVVQSSIVTPEALRALEEWGNCLKNTTSPLSVAEDLITLFESAVERNPEDVAAQVVRGQHMTYRELDHRASTVAAILCDEYDVKPGEVVCVDANRSLDWIVSIFAVLKSGAAYCALDHELPKHLRSVMFASTGARVFLASTASIAVDRGPKDCLHSLGIDELITREAATRSDNARPGIWRRHVPTPEATAYVCFTSGSTGAPKGVVCTHQGLVAFQRDPEVRLFAGPGVKVAQVMSPAFDGSIHEIFSSLCYGATLILSPSENTNVTEALNFAHSAILTPSLAEVLDPADYPELKTVYLVGEVVKQAVNDRWASYKALYNMYGPTEATCGATIKRLCPGQPVTIGRPNPSTRVYILRSASSTSQDLQFMPPGAIGDICLAGVQVSRGYLGMPVLSSERFIRDPFCKTPTKDYLYRTGDRGYWSPDGELVCLGRDDRQIKLRGFRLDLNDLEARVAQANPGIPGLKSVAIAQREDYLVAAMQPAELALCDELVGAVLKEVLPLYAQPRHIMYVDKWPMTRAGKLDYKVLVSDDSIETASRKNDAARAGASHSLVQCSLEPLEVKIASVWREVLGLNPSEPIGRVSGFLQLGGDSLQQIKMLARLSSGLKVRLPLKLAIESRTLGELAKRLAEFNPQQQEPMELPHPAQPLDRERCSTSADQALPCRTPLSPAEASWWIKYRMHPCSNTSAFNVSFVASLSPAVDRDSLCRALDTVVSRYTLFRGLYLPSRGRKDREQGYWLAERRYVQTSPKVQKLRHMNTWAEVNRPFDLEREPPIRLSVTDDTLTIVMSHIVADLTALNILLGEVAALYHGKSLPRVVRSYELEAVPSMWSHEPSQGDLDFWKDYLGCPQPGVSSSPKRNGYCGTSRLYRLANPLGLRLIRFSKAQKNENALSLQQLAAAAVGLALSALDQRPDERGAQRDHTDIILGIPFINRSSADDMETVGLFLEPLPIRVRYAAPTCNEADNAQAYLESVRASALAALSHSVPWHRLVRHGVASHHGGQQAQPSGSAPVEGAEVDAPFDTMVTFHHAENSVQLDIPGVMPRMAWADGAKFPLMAEFTALENGAVLLRTEYDTQRYTANEIDRRASAIAAALDMLTAGEARLSFTCMKRMLRGATPVLDPALVNFQANAFGMSLKDLASCCQGADPSVAPGDSSEAIGVGLAGGLAAAPVKPRRRDPGTDIVNGKRRLDAEESLYGPEAGRDRKVFRLLDRKRAKALVHTAPVVHRI